jgi:hypothetical protein
VGKSLNLSQPHFPPMSTAGDVLLTLENYCENLM